MTVVTHQVAKRQGGFQPWRAHWGLGAGRGGGERTTGGFGLRSSTAAKGTYAAFQVTLSNDWLKCPTFAALSGLQPLQSKQAVRIINATIFTNKTTKKSHRKWKQRSSFSCAVFLLTYCSTNLYSEPKLILSIIFTFQIFLMRAVSSLKRSLKIKQFSIVTITTVKNIKQLHQN